MLGVWYKSVNLGAERSLVSNQRDQTDCDTSSKPAWSGLRHGTKAAWSMFRQESRDSPACPVRSPSISTEPTLRTVHGARGRCSPPRDQPLTSAARSRETRDQRTQRNRLSVRPPSTQPHGAHAHPSDQPARAREGRSRILRGQGKESRMHCANSPMVGALKTRKQARRKRARRPATRETRFLSPACFVETSTGLQEQPRTRTRRFTRGASSKK